ncbi:DUF2911 domain-containing protein [Tellurirhabdus rosea]|uniref:DUF2911 domain-containing protein n=1 Tax=Tellurirhabdus rosea TaxID=2674997 RepID=UPI0022515CC6|nr:DUF2911 domain-containing protein [Tellurirhabdus rosea]
MKKALVQVAAFCLVAQLATAQIRLPQPSPSAAVMQTVGVTDITVKYSRPAMKGREIFGQLVPYGQLWRTGANAATTFQASTDVLVEGQKLPAGTYSIFTIPAQNEWTLIFNRNTGASTDAYKQEEDALRVKIKPATTSEKVESFFIGFSDLTDSTAKMDIAWANVKAAANLRVDVNTTAQANVEKAVAEKPEDSAVLTAAANYNLSKGRNLDQALAWVDKSIGLKENFRNLWVKSQILAKMGKVAQALPLAQKALSLGETSGDASFRFFKDAIAKNVSDYQAALPQPAQLIKGKKKK